MNALDTGDTGFLLISAALVMLMTPALGLFYGGMVRRKNVLGTIMQSFFILGLVSIVWAVLGYSLAFAPGGNAFIGSTAWIGLRGVGQAPSDYAHTVPHLAFMVFQLMFAVITPALITGAFAERMKFGGFLLFVVLWSLLVYSPICHWVWGKGGWIAQLGALDFAGGTVVHISSGAAALAAALVVGRRRAGADSMAPHNVPMTILGAAMLWFGWFGFNAGSALGVTDGSIIGRVAINTNLAAALGGIAAMITVWRRFGKPDLSMAMNGALAGLVAITAPCAYVEPWAAIVIGATAGYIVVKGVELLDKLQIDDPVGAVPVHGICGIWGTLCVGIFGKSTLGLANNGFVYSGNPMQLGIQIVGSVTAVAFVVLTMTIVFKLIDLTLGLRVGREEELRGLDIGEHGMEAYGGFQIFSTS